MDANIAAQLAQGNEAREVMRMTLESLGAFVGFNEMRINTINAVAWQGYVAARKNPNFEDRIDAGIVDAMGYVEEIRKLGL